MKPIELTADTFQETVLEAEGPVLVDFWASWCGPCRMLSPVVDELAEEYGDRVVFGKVNVDEQQELALRYDVASIPTLLLFKNGAVADSSVGVVPKGSIAAMLGV